jgi:Mn-dependent DtxR family transcriptional regulator
MLPKEEYITRHKGPIVLTEAVGDLYELFVKMTPKRPLDVEFISERLRFAKSSVTDMINKLNRHYEVKKRADGMIRLQRPPRKSPKAKRLQAAA